MGFLQDFEKFAFRGNVIDLAVGVVVGGAFNKIVGALVDDVVMPLVSLFMPSGNWRAAGFVIRHKPDPMDDVVLRYGDLMGSVLDFFVIALVLFVVVKRGIDAAERSLMHSQSQAPSTRACPDCLSDIPIEAKRCKHCTSNVPAHT